MQSFERVVRVKCGFASRNINLTIHCHKKKPSDTTGKVCIGIETVLETCEFLDSRGSKYAAAVYSGKLYYEVGILD